MMHPIIGAILIVISLTLGFFLATTNFDSRRVIDCSMVEYHPDLVKYREQCREFRRGAR